MIQKSKRPFLIAKQAAICWGFLLPNLVGVLYFSLLPMLRVLVRSFQSAIGGEWVGLRNYRMVMNNAAFRLAVGNTAQFIAVCIPLLLIVSLVLAVSLCSLPKLGRELRSAFLMPMAVPAASVVLVWKFCFTTRGL